MTDPDPAATGCHARSTVARRPVRRPSAPASLKPPGTAAAGPVGPAGATAGGSPRPSRARCSRSAPTYLFVSGILWTPLFGTPYEVDGYLSPLFSPLIAPGRGCRPGSAPASSSCGSRSASGRPATTTARPTTASTSPTRRAARSASRRSTGGYAMETAFPFILQNLHRYFLYLAFDPAVLPVARRASRRSCPPGGSGSGSAACVFFVNVRAADRLLAVVPLAAPHRRRPARLLLVHAPARRCSYSLWQRLTSAQPPSHGLGLGEPHVRDAGRRVRPVARAGVDPGPRDPPVSAEDRPTASSTPRRPGHRGRRRRTAGGDRGGRPGPIRRARLQVAAGQGPHGHGRGRGRRRARPCRPDATPGRRTSATRWSAARCSTTRGWPSSTRRRRPIASASWSSGAPSSTGPATGGSSSARSAAIRIRAWPMSATGPGSR